MIAYYEQKQKPKDEETAVQNNVSETTGTHDDKEQETESANIKRMNSLGYLTIEQAHEYLGINLQIISNARKNSELDSKKSWQKILLQKGRS